MEKNESIKESLREIWKSWKPILHESVQALKDFLKNPVEGMKTPPDWPWQQVLVVQGGLAAFCGIASAILSGNLLAVIASIVFLPLTVFIVSAIATGFLYYLILFFFEKTTNYVTLYRILFFAQVPGLIFQVLTVLVPPISLLSIACTLLLTAVGLHSVYQLNQRKLLKWMAGIFFIYFVFWGIHTIQLEQSKKIFKHQATPETLDILERELRDKGSSN